MFSGTVPQVSAEKIACVDIGGTYIKSSLLHNGKLRRAAKTATPSKEGADAVADVVCGLIKEMDADCAGISTAGEVCPKNGAIIYSSNIKGYSGYPLCEKLEKRLGISVTVENDVNAAAVGEMNFGAAKGLSDFVMLTYGTGIGGCAVINGKVYKGHSGQAGEFGGLMCLRSPKAEPESYEQLASTTALVESVQKVAPDVKEASEIFSQYGLYKEVLPVLESWTEQAACGIAGIIHCFNPEAVVLGGGIMEQEQVIALLKKQIIPMLKPSFLKTPLLKASLGNSAALYGAGYLAEQRKDG